MFDCYKSNTLYHFEKILKDNGFVLEEYNEDIKKVNINEIIIEKKIEGKELFDKYLEDPDKTNIKYEKINNNITLLNLPKKDEGNRADARLPAWERATRCDHKEILSKYSEVIYNEKKLKEHMNIIRFMRDDKYVNNKISELNIKSYPIRYKDNIYYKIYLLRSLMRRYKIDYFDITKNVHNLDEILLEDQQWEVYKKVFRLTKEKPKNMYEILIMIIRLIKHITSNDIVTCIRKEKNKVFYYIYQFNDEIIKEHLTLNHYRNPDCNNFHKYFYDHYDLHKNDDIKNYFLDI